MGNMSYCRFENTSSDLSDCMDEFTEPVSTAEHQARIRLVRHCAELVFDYAGARTIQEAEDWARVLDTK